MCDLTKLPPHPPANASMIFIIPKQHVNSNATGLYTLSDPIRISWDLWTPSWIFLGKSGSMHKYGECWICEFSGKTADFEGSCGPTPFDSSGIYLMNFLAQDIDSSVKFNRTNIVIHSETITIGAKKGKGGVNITAATQPDVVDPPTITMYDAVTGESLSLSGYGDDPSVEMEEGTHPGTFYYTLEDLDPGIYYLSFRFTRIGGQSGGDLLKIEISKEDIELTVATDKGSYLVGETVEITGRTIYPSVSATVENPSGITYRLDPVEPNVDDQYLLLFHITDEDEGDYEVKVTAGGKSETTNFKVTGKALDVGPTSLVFDLVDVSEDRTVLINNTGTSSVTLTIIEEGDISEHVTTDLGDNVLQAGSGTTLTVTADPLKLTETRTTGKVNVMAGDVTIPVDVSINYDISVISRAGEYLQVVPSFWNVKECMVGESVRKTFTLKNIGTGQIENFGYTEGGQIEVTDAELPDSLGDTSKSMDLTISAKSATADGYVEVTSSGGTAKIYVSMDCISQDFGEDVSDLEESMNLLMLEFEDKNYDSETIDDLFFTVNDKINDAKSSLDSGDYAYAMQSYASARAKLETLQEVSTFTEAPAGEVDLTWVYIIVIIVVIGVVGLFLYSRFGSRLLKRGGEEETDEDEDLY
ncbi:MAG: hypothetical protein JSV63_03595 [Candidatus Aenigmatarchaeota archaeon]|nr:MAG: hypothetical protein JSV63_03595 [Candidatus Aenigmarchaeota archaeon]